MIYELRTYYPNPGKMEALNARFRNHTCRLFEKHGIKNIGYWTPAAPGDERLIYVVAHTDAAAAARSWESFRNDPAWHKVVAESEKDGKLAAKVESVYLNATDFSALR